MVFNAIQSDSIYQSIEFNPIKPSIQLNLIILNYIRFWIELNYNYSKFLIWIKLIQVTLIYFNLI